MNGPTRLLVLAAATGLSAGPTCRCQSPSPPDWTEREWLAGDPGGVRRALRERGLDVGLRVMTDASFVAAGGVDERSSAIRSLWDLELLLDAERALGWSGAQVYVDLQLQQGPDGSRDTGDIQVYSNIDGPDRRQLAQFWFEQRLFGDGLRVRLGKMDANDEFALVEHGTTHVHSSFGFSPTVAGFPSYPDPAFGVAVFAEPDRHTYCRAAVYDGATQAGTATGPRGAGTVFGAPADLFVVGEAGVRWGHGSLPVARVSAGGATPATSSGATVRCATASRGCT